MRFTLALWSRRPMPVREVPPQERTPLKLKDRVTTSLTKKETACMNELGILIACLNRNDYNNGPCSQEVLNLQNCHKDVLVRNKENAKLKMQKDITHNMKEFTHKQITSLLRKYPTV